MMKKGFDIFKGSGVQLIWLCKKGFFGQYFCKFKEP